MSDYVTPDEKGVISDSIQSALTAFRARHPWYTPKVEAAHKILCDMADNLDTTERRLAFGELKQTLSNLYALQIALNKAIDLLKQ